MTEHAETRIMAIDFGLKRIGIALSDSLQMFAYAHKTILNNSTTLNEIDKIVKEKNVTKFILGIPNEERQNKNSKTSIINNVKKFKESLEKKFSIEVELWDETYTSAIAQQKILESVNKKVKRQNKDLLDMYSAAIILQEYLDSIKRNNQSF
ncbi:MAG: Holliday junction resolvase RuvX [Ignavibacteriaceae bacterium]|nr:Holliday junction resolvase RuvX [Ignavibacteriaceae bacterium]HRN25269.1 Holliday junction resolvase RuvX [Ignavibacteriaceae bacterium]HRP93776.1 Holliday junction resolvase RuvX [Ignavibacteriaceae bacterium]HRQ52860.1 Holliday junction resolvase RuvX [Ignavibacteriaceae bacterium]